MAKITVPEERTVVEVTPWPDEVQVIVSALDGNLSPDQARKLAELLVEAADKSAFLDWKENEKGEFDLVDKTPVAA